MHVPLLSELSAAARTAPTSKIVPMAKTPNLTESPDSVPAVAGERRRAAKRRARANPSAAEPNRPATMAGAGMN
jgi:hypothetical protein